MQIEPLENYDYYTYPFVALVGIVSKVIVFNTNTMTAVRSVRVLVQNWQSFRGVKALPDDSLAIGCLDGSLKTWLEKGDNFTSDFRSHQPEKIASSSPSLSRG